MIACQDYQMNKTEARLHWRPVEFLEITNLKLFLILMKNIKYIIKGAF